MSSEAESLIERYLRDLETGLRDLPAGRRRQFLDEVRGRIARARAAVEGEAAETEAGVRELLHGIGDPAQLASEARRRYGRRDPRSSRGSDRRFEVIALVLLMIPFAGWATGVVLVWMSRVWSTRDKIIGTVGGMSWVLAGLATLLVSAAGSAPVGATPVQTADPGPLAFVVFVIPFALPVVAAVYLAIRLRSIAPPPVTRRPPD
jgi:uncharacterized membrane protein